MSWETLNWAGKQRTDNVAMQCTLFVIANAADPDGVAFRWWRRADHWWTYLVERTGLARGSIYRTLNRLEEMGLIKRDTITPDDGGKPQPVVRLQLDKIHIAADESPRETEAQTQSPTETENESQSLPGRPDESPSETPLYMSPSKNPDSPNPKPLSPSQPLQASPASDPDSPPPSVQTPTESGEEVQSPERQKRWSRFCSTYPEGVLDIEKAKDEFEALTDQEQIDCLAGEELFADRCKRLRQKPGKAHVFIRKRTWVGLLAAKPATKRSLIFELVSIASDEGRALANLYRMTHVGEPVRCRNERGQECYSVPVKPSQQVMGMANVPRWSEWKFYGLELPNASRWRHFIEAATGKAMVIKYQKSRPGIYAPNPWPPRIDGTWCDTPETPSTGPPEETPEEASGELASAMGF